MSEGLQIALTVFLWVVSIAGGLGIGLVIHRMLPDFWEGFGNFVFVVGIGSLYYSVLIVCGDWVHGRYLNGAVVSYGMFVYFLFPLLISILFIMGCVAWGVVADRRALRRREAWEAERKARNEARLAGQQSNPLG